MTTIKEYVCETTVTFKDPENQYELIKAITSIEDGTKAMEHFLSQCAMFMVQEQRALDGLCRLGKLKSE
jgi:hypothetical protein